MKDIVVKMFCGAFELYLYMGDALVCSISRISRKLPLVVNDTGMGRPPPVIRT